MNRFLIILITVFVVLISVISSIGAVIKGKVTDESNGEPLEFVLVQIKGSQLTTETSLDGKFKFENVEVGEYTLIFKMLDYSEREEKVVIKEAGEEVKITIAMISIEKEVAETVVQGKIDRESEVHANKQEFKADNIINVVSARAIELSPDITVANVSQRVSGISLERSSQGDGRYAIIRGMDQRYNNTLINGVKIPSPDAKNRSVPLDIFPSDLLQKMEVSKTLTPDMEGDAIGGTINMVMKDAPDSVLVSLNLASGYNHYLFNHKFNQWNYKQTGEDPAVTYGNNYYPSITDFNKNTLDISPKQASPNLLAGFTVGKRIWKGRLGFITGLTYQDTYRASRSVVYDIATNTNGEPIPVNVQDRYYSTHQIRTGINVKTDFRISKKHRISWYNVYLNLKDIQHRKISDTSLTSNRTVPGTGGLDITDRTRYQLQEIFNSTLQGDHQIFKKVLLNWSAVYSSAIQNIPDRSEILRDFTITTPPGTEDSARFFSIRRDWQKNKDQDYAGYLNLSYSPTIFGLKTELRTGGLYRYKIRTNQFNDYYFPLLAGATAPYYTGINNVPDSILQVYYNPANSVLGSNNYTADEQVGAYYYSAKIRFGKLQVLGGVRTEFTFQKFETKAPLSFNVPNAAEIRYTDLLPSIHFKYHLTEKQNIRLSYFQSISRPNYFELVPTSIIGDRFNEVGNPRLKHTEAANYDLRYEFFPNFREQFMAGVFYKDIKNPIEYGFTSQTSKDIAPQNFGNAVNLGFELVAVKFLGNIGIISNYTFTNSSITTSKIFNDYQNGQTYLKDDTRALQGQAMHIGNLSVLYRHEKTGLNVQLACVYTGRRITQVSYEYGLDFYQRPVVQLDFSLEKRLLKKVFFFAKLTNLLNSPFVVELKNGMEVQRDTYSQNYIAGLYYRFKK